MDMKEEEIKNALEEKIMKIEDKKDQEWIIDMKKEEVKDVLKFLKTILLPKTILVTILLPKAILVITLLKTIQTITLILKAILKVILKAILKATHMMIILIQNFQKNS